MVFSFAIMLLIPFVSTISFLFFFLIHFFFPFPQATFSNVPQWLQEVTKYAQNPNLVKVLAGNKCDLPDHTVTKEEGNTYGSSNGMKFFETSAKDSIGITEAFQWIVEEIIRVQTGDDDGGNDSGGKGCCTLL